MGRRRSGYWCVPGSCREINKGPCPEGYQAVERSSFSSTLDPQERKLAIAVEQAAASGQVLDARIDELVSGIGEFICQSRSEPNGTATSFTVLLLHDGTRAPGHTSI